MRPRLPESLEARIQACWDERADPLADPDVQAMLLAHPEALEEFARWRAAVDALPAAPAAGAMPRANARWARIAAAAAVILALAAVAAWLQGARSAASPAVAHVRLVASRLEHEPRTAGLAAPCQLRRKLVDTARTQFEIVEQWSVTR